MIGLSRWNWKVLVRVATRKDKVFRQTVSAVTVSVPHLCSLEDARAQQKEVLVGYEY